MAEVPGVEALAPIRPRDRPLLVIGRITSPLAAASDSHLGGIAVGNRFVLNDAMQFVWWTADGRAFASGFSGAFR